MINERSCKRGVKMEQDRNDAAAYEQNWNENYKQLAAITQLLRD